VPEERRPSTVADPVTTVPPDSAGQNVAPEKVDERRALDPQDMGSADRASSQAAQQQDDYAELKRLIVQQGLLDKQPAYYVSKALLGLVLLGASLAILLVVESFWLQLLNAAFLAFVFTQIGYLGHDAGHRQIFNGAPKNDMVGLTINLLLGLSRSWWVDTHNQHHTTPNDLELDPHTALPIFAFSEEQARGKRGILRLLV